MEEKSVVQSDSDSALSFPVLYTKEVASRHRLAVRPVAVVVLADELEVLLSAGFCNSRFGELVHQRCRARIRSAVKGYVIYSVRAFSTFSAYRVFF